MLTETFFSRLPPPTEKTRTPSRELILEPSSHAAKQVSQPSSLARAVSSETLSVGAYASKPQILRKSFTACPACPAEPPTPRLKRRPPPSRAAPRPTASFSIESASSFWMIARLSSRKVFVNVLMGTPVESEGSCDQERW